MGDEVTKSIQTMNDAIERFVGALDKLDYRVDATARFKGDDDIEMDLLYQHGTNRHKLLVKVHDSRQSSIPLMSSLYTTKLAAVSAFSQLVEDYKRNYHLRTQGADDATATIHKICDDLVGERVFAADED